MRRGKTARSSTECVESTRRGAKSMPSRRRRMKSWTMTSFGVSTRVCRDGVRSECSTDRIKWKCWDDYQEAYEEMVQNTATKRAPWYVVPADNKWYGRLVVASAIIEALDGLNLAFPDVDKEKKKELETIREALLADKD